MVTKHASSHYVSIRGLRYHYRQWDVAANELAPEEAALKEAARSDAGETRAGSILVHNMRVLKFKVILHYSVIQPH